MRPKDLMIQAASINFDIQSYMNQNLIIVVRVAPPTDIYQMANPDEFLIEYLNDIVTVVNQYNPSRIIFDELTPYVGFNNIDLLREVFLHTLETIEERDISSLFLIGEPATPTAQDIINTISQYATGVIYLKKELKRDKGMQPGGTVVITPNVGHTEGQFSDRYVIMPYKGVVVEESEAKFSKDNEIITPELNYSGTKDDLRKTVVNDNPTNLGNRYTQIEIDEPTPSPPNINDIDFSSIYNSEDFHLILNNQIALYKSTGQKFNLISFKLDPAAHVKGLLTLNQLQKAVINSTDKKDKVCIIDNKVISLLIKSNKAGAIQVAEKLKRSLPSKDEKYIDAVLDYITMIQIQVDERVENAEGMLNFILSEETSSDNYYEPLKKITD